MRGSDAWWTAAVWLLAAAIVIGSTMLLWVAVEIR